MKQKIILKGNFPFWGGVVHVGHKDKFVQMKPAQQQDVIELYNIVFDA